MKTKKSKKMFIIPIVSVLVLATIVGVGFAAWTIINPVNETINDAGSFVAETLEDRTFTATAVASDDIVFGKNPSFTGATWLSDTKVANQNLTATITVTLTPKVAGQLNPTVGEGLKVADYLNGNNLQVGVNFLGTKSGEEYTNTTAFATCVSATYLNNPTLVTTKPTGLEPEYTPATATGSMSGGDLVVVLTDKEFEIKEVGGKNVAVATLTITFSWGEKTNFVTPSEYYSDKSYDEKATEAEQVITAVYALNGAKYGITLKTVAAA